MTLYQNKFINIDDGRLITHMEVKLTAILASYEEQAKISTVTRFIKNPDIVITFGATHIG